MNRIAAGYGGIPSAHAAHRFKTPPAIFPWLQPSDRRDRALRRIGFIALSRRGAAAFGGTPTVPAMPVRPGPTPAGLGATGPKSTGRDLLGV